MKNIITILLKQKTKHRNTNKIKYNIAKIYNGKD
uniref:Uncharacterized protein n=1 Tax=viral metagenome TaxID=1070528 RepID=A0A6C0EWG8_9ZZZZ